jgi:Actinobacteria/chloroflexi VLRF1 release factor
MRMMGSRSHGPPVVPRRITVPADRLRGWLAELAARHSGLTWTREGQQMLAAADDGTWARVHVPFEAAGEDWVSNCEQRRLLGLLLVRRGGFAVGVARDGLLTASKVGSRHVQGKTKAGGWSQQRFARRRDKQAREAFQAAADACDRLLVSRARSLDGLVTGGDRLGVATVLADPRLAPVAALPSGRFLAVADPRQRVLVQAARDATRIEIEIWDPSAP